MRPFTRILQISFLFTAISLCACQNSEAPQPEAQSRYRTGELPAQTPELLQAEFSAYRAQHPELDEASARDAFEEIQLLSSLYPDARTAIWADRRALARAWLKREVEDVYHPDTIDDAFIQSAIDAYAFKSGHPALVTASHILIRPDTVTTPEKRRQALEAIRSDLIQSQTYTNEALSAAAQRLTRAGFRVDMNPDLTFPRHAMKSFLGESLSYQAVVEPFADAAFKLSESSPLSPVVESEFGYHLILFRNRTEEKKAHLPQDRDFMVSRIVHQGRTLGFAQQLEEAMQAVPIRINQEKIGELTSTKPN